MARPNFMEKTFTGGSKTTKFVKFFSLKSFPLYGIYYRSMLILSSHPINYTETNPHVSHVTLFHH